MHTPNLICVGAEKSGTTTLYNILANTNNIFAIRKETEFFTFLNKQKLKKYYINNLTEYKKLFKNFKNQKYALDVSTTYLHSDNAINNIYNLCNNPKIIICLRNPSDRAYSRYWMAAKTDYSLNNFSFEKFKYFFLNHNKQNQFKWNNVRYRGMYYQQIKNFYKKFDKKNILIVYYEDFKSKNILESKLSEFLAIKIIYNQEVYAESLYSNNKFVHKLLNFSFNFYIPEKRFVKFLKNIFRKVRKTFLKKYPEMSYDIRNYLTQYYLQDIKKTEKLLNVNLAHWYK